MSPPRRPACGSCSPRPRNIYEGAYVLPLAAFEAGGRGERVEVGLRPPRVQIDASPTVTDGEYSEVRAVGRPVIDRLGDDVGADDDGDDKVYLVALVDTADGPRALAYREPTAPPPAAYGPTRTNEAWASTLVSNQVLRAQDLVQVEFEMDLDEVEEMGLVWPDGSVAPGLLDPSVGVSIEGAAWMITEATVNHDTRRASYTGTRPADPSGLVSTATAGGPGDYEPPAFASSHVYARIDEEQSLDQGGNVDGPPTYTAVSTANGAGDRTEHQHLVGGAWASYAGPLVVDGADDHQYYRAREHYDTYGRTSDWAYAGTDGSTEPPEGAPA